MLLLYTLTVRKNLYNYIIIMSELKLNQFIKLIALVLNETLAKTGIKIYFDNMTNIREMVLRWHSMQKQIKQDYDWQIIQILKKMFIQ